MNDTPVRVERSIGNSNLVLGEDDLLSPNHDIAAMASCNAHEVGIWIIIKRNLS